ncbi:DUF3794 domain-containing protein [Sporomusa acidovorans]|uniref:SipL SPOCS domain-containing protein n=1 Tax=Sporomusa acidovorans (strain ATCC 49682 / DSM 3132 / Mol) TaxID=1123286 RepID=A0ABZ3J7W2_SPOA4|nr:DUF3794 domain-containing protein [Sporomusa acidovorans]OZC16695.1 hypothetical protein SPACI_41660 [Sporomusa acidovorans DSM 3132]SDE05749.1 protein of unknown function [Sporomusa acidovorans]
MTHIEPWEKCTLGYGPKTIVVQQVLGERQVQKSIDVHVVVPRHKPAIEQIVDVFVKKLRITDVDVIPNKVVVRGQFEVKALYVACRPRQPVHAVEVWPVRFTAYADIRGARRGMEADASVIVEYVDYDCDEYTRAHWHKKKGPDYDDCDDDYDYDDCDDDYDDCDDDYDDCDDDYDDCDDDYDDCGGCDYLEECHHQHKPYKKQPCKPCCEDDYDHHCKPHKRPRRCTRRFDVAVVLGITVKVMTDREVFLNPPPQALPYKPKG